MVFMPDWPKQIGYKPIDFGLDRVLELLDRLGNPHKKLPPVVHFAGTNGKGSTSAFLRSFLEAAGYKVHVYSSPHLMNFNERIVLAGREISDDYLKQLSEECRIAAGDMRITFFEGTTALAYLAFSRTQADIVLLETGMGGRLDATNIIDKPACTVITPISLDHTEYLGNDIRLIAGEKVGILKHNVPCVSSLQTEEAHLVIEQKADALAAPLFSLGYDWMVDKTETGMKYESKRGDIDLPKPSLLGDHQIVNAGTAITVTKCLKDFTITDEHIIAAIQNTKWPARMQQITKGDIANKLPENWEIWVDGMHNAAGAQIISTIIDDWDDKPTYIICGFTKGRDATSILSYFKNNVSFACGILVQSEPSAQKAEEVANAAIQSGLDAKSFDSIDEAVYFLTHKFEKPARILVCGSLYLASDLMKAS